MAEYRVDALAREAGTTVGNVRVYQDRDLLPPPLKRGRVAIYTEAHLARLRIIRNLLDRGYAFAQIREILTAWETGRDLSDLLGLERVLTQPWSDETPQRVPLETLAHDLGRYAGSQELTDGFRRATGGLGMLERDGDHVIVRSPRLLHTTLELLAAGVPLATVLDLAEDVQRHTDELARTFLAMVDDHLVPPRTDGDGHHTGWAPKPDEVPDLTERARRLRPLAQAAVSAFLARSMSTAMATWVADRFGPLLHRDYPHNR